MENDKIKLSDRSGKGKDNLQEPFLSSTNKMDIKLHVETTPM
jgi:hypothetical protein